MPCKNPDGGGGAVGKCAEEKRWVVEPDPRGASFGERHRPQCLLCGQCGGNAYPPPEVNTFTDVVAAKAYKTAKDHERAFERERERAAEETRRWIEREREDAEWHRGHQEYLRSDVWRKKRALVMKRDKFLCQGCHRERAQAVHHLTYDTANQQGWGREPLWELVATCHSCHDRYHNRD